MKRLLAVAAAATALTLTAACGSSDAGSGSGPSGSAASSGSSATEAAVRQGDTVSMAELGKQMQAAMQDKGSAKVSMKSSAVTMTGAMKTTAPVAYTMSMKASGQSMDMIYVDKVLYLGGESLASMLNGKKWVKIDPDGTDALSRQMAPTLKQMERAADPSKMYQNMNDVKLTVDSVDGDDVTYSAKLTEAQVRQYVKEQGSTIPSGTKVGAMTMTMTATKDGLPQRMTTDVMGEAIQMTYSDWGAPVDIAAPPAGDIGSISGS